MRNATVVLALSLIFLGCVSTSTTHMSDNSADPYIRAAAPRFMTAFNAGDTAKVASFYADDAVFLAPNSDITSGREAIRKAFEPFAAAKANLSFSTDRIVQSCDVAYEHGHYQMQMGSMTDRGKYLTVWRKMPGGDWKIVADMFNTNEPAPAH